MCCTTKNNNLEKNRLIKSEEEYSPTMEGQEEPSSLSCLKHLPRKEVQIILLSQAGISVKVTVSITTKMQLPLREQHNLFAPNE